MLVTQKGQTLVEYTLVVGIVLIVLFSMNTLIQRGSQRMIKLVADQIGNQEDSEQDFDSGGHLISTYSSSRVMVDKNTKENEGITTYLFNDTTHTESNSLINMGFREDS